jgi:hypothetical protein
MDATTLMNAETGLPGSWSRCEREVGGRLGGRPTGFKTPSGSDQRQTNLSTKGGEASSPKMI